MTTSAIDYFTQLTTNLKALAGRQTENRKRFAQGDRRGASSQALIKLAETLTMLPPESSQRVAYNSVMDHAAALKLGPSIAEVERDHVEDFRMNARATDDAGPFLESLTADIDGLIDDAELDANNDACGRSAHEADIANAGANEIAHGIACKKAADGAREAAEEAYRLAYQWAYEDIFEEAYHQALSQLT